MCSIFHCLLFSSVKSCFMQCLINEQYCFVRFEITGQSRNTYCEFVERYKKQMPKGRAPTDFRQVCLISMQHKYVLWRQG